MPDQPQPPRKRRTAKQRDASRRNGAHSKGPITEAGKAISSRNHTTHGLCAYKNLLLNNESPAVLDAVRDGYIDRFQPTDLVELDLVEQVVAAQWRLRRYSAVETALIDDAMAAQRRSGFVPTYEGQRAARAFRQLAADDPALALAGRYQSRLTRDYYRAMKTFLDLRRDLPPAPGYRPLPLETPPARPGVNFPFEPDPAPAPPPPSPPSVLLPSLLLALLFLLLLPLQAKLPFEPEPILSPAESFDSRLLPLPERLSPPNRVSVAGTSPGGLALDPQGNLLIADRGNRRIRQLTIDGLTVDAAGNIYVSEYPRLSVIAPDGRIRILTGYAGENDAGVKAYLDEARRGCDSIAVSPAGRIYLALRLEGKVISASPAPSSSPDAPRISNAGITQQGFSKPAIVNVSPRTILSIYGGPFLSGAPVVAGAGPSLPTKLGGVCVWFGAAAAPLFAVAADSVTSHGLLPGVNTRPAKAGDYLTLYALGPGVNSRPAKAGDYLTPHALGPGVNSRPAKAGDYLTLYALGPGVNSRPAKAGAYLTLYALGPGVNSRPAKAGDYLTLYALGLGDTIPAGAPTPGLARVTGAVEVKIGGLTLTPDQTLYAGLSPTWTGLYQVNVLLPQAVPDGDQPVTVSIGGIASPPGRYLTVKQQQ